MAGYPTLFGTQFKGSCTVGTVDLVGTPIHPGGVIFNTTITKSGTTYLNSLGTQLNGIIKGAVKSSGKWATYVDPTKTFKGHGFCDSQAQWLNPMNATEVLTINSLTSYSWTRTYLDPFSFHPTVTGQLNGYKPAFVTAGL